MSEDLWLTAGKVRMIPRGQYASNHVYRMLDVVYYEYGAYIAKQNGVITPPYNDDPEQLNEGWVELVKLPFEKSDYEELVNQYLNELTFIYKGEHDFTIPYQQSNIVTALNSTESNYDLYIAIKEVPVNISISNTNYWVKFFDSELLHDTIVEDVAQLTENVEELTTIIGTDSSQGSIKGDIKEIKDTIGSDGVAAGSIKSGIKGNIKDIQDEIGSENINDTIKGNIKILQNEIGDDGIDEGSVKSGIKGDIKDIQDEIGSDNTNNTIKGNIKNIQDNLNLQIPPPIQVHTTYQLSSTTPILSLDYYTLGNKNSFVYEINLGESFTDAQQAAISNGTFNGLYLGAYWEINGIKWRIWSFDWYYGKMRCYTHHCVIIPDTILVENKSMEDTATTVHGYSDSKMRNTHLDSAKTIIFNAFNEDYILPHSQYLCKTGTSDGASDYQEYANCTVELPSESMLYGCSAKGRGRWNTNNNFPILPLALFKPQYISYKRQSYWLRDVADDQQFAQLSFAGVATCGLANTSLGIGIRPYFFLCGDQQTTSN